MDIEKIVSRDYFRHTTKKHTYNSRCKVYDTLAALHKGQKPGGKGSRGKDMGHKVFRGGGGRLGLTQPKRWQTRARRNLKIARGASFVCDFTFSVT